MWQTTSRRKITDVALCIFVFAFHSKEALAQASRVKWLYPSQDGLTFYYQDTINITYESTVSLPYLGIYCTQGVGQLMQHADIPAIDATATLTASVTLDLKNGTDLQSTDVDGCWVAVRESYNGDGTNGPSWSYVHTSRASGPSTLGLSASAASTPGSTIATATPTPTSTGFSTTSGTASPTEAGQISTTGADSSSTGLSAPASIGIGVAAGVVAILLMLAAFIFIRRYRKRQRGEPQTGPGPLSPGRKPETASGDAFAERPFTTNEGYPPQPYTQNTFREPVELNSARENTHAVEMQG